MKIIPHTQFLEMNEHDLRCGTVIFASRAWPIQSSFPCVNDLTLTILTFNVKFDKQARRKYLMIESVEGVFKCWKNEIRMCVW